MPSNSMNASSPSEDTLTALREKVNTERWFFIARWCRERGLSPMVAHNYDRAAAEWAFQNSPPKTSIHHD